MRSNKAFRIGREVKITFFKYLFAIVLAALIGAALLAAQGESPINAYKLILEGSFGSIGKLGNTIRWTIPCLIGGAAAIIALKSGFRNMGIEGQVYMGAFAAAVAGAYLELPGVPHVLLCLLVSGITGLLWILLPAVLKLYFNVSELISTLMMNYVALQFTQYLVIWKIMGGKQTASGSAAIATPAIHETAYLPNIIKTTSANAGLFIGLAICLIIWFVYKYTIAGYEARQIGENMGFARAGGVNIVKRFIGVFLVSGFVAGLCGGVEVCGAYHSFTDGFSSNLGWEAILVARVCANNPIALIAVSLVWGALKAGALHMERMISVNRLTVNIIQMLFILFVAVDYNSVYTRIMQWLKRAKAKKDEGGREK